MTSWIRVAPKKKKEEVRSLFFKLEEGEFCGQFNQFLYSKLYAESLNRPLITYDRSNPVSANFPLIQGTFDTGNTTFSDGMVPNVTIIMQRDMNKIYPYITGLSTDDLRTKASEILQWNSATLATVASIKKQNMVPECDVGVHIRTPESRERLPVMAYIGAITEVYNRLKKDTIDVFVASENSTLLQDFLTKVPPTWRIHMIQNSSPVASGFSQVSFDRQPARIRLAMYNEFLANLVCLQSVSNLITSLSSDVGRFLYLTNETMTHFRSMDVPTFTPF